MPFVANILRATLAIHELPKDYTGLFLGCSNTDCPSNKALLNECCDNPCVVKIHALDNSNSRLDLQSCASDPPGYIGDIDSGCTPGVRRSLLLLRFVDNTFNGSYTMTIGVDIKISTTEIDGQDGILLKNALTTNDMNMSSMSIN
ncbi:uncharacterized protein [Venturia canescens]|uniref:uncharacterized protein n=1 Tax=Venturia canescens TaxID=32260 RepID=UPI001C9C4230|nr:uncharacterized protein LOC122406738 [Venturia canescens]XP_043287552.1 uncharacterized protein LOC122417814 [Venturia canescens]